MKVSILNKSPCFHREKIRYFSSSSEDKDKLEIDSDSNDSGSLVVSPANSFSALTLEEEKKSDKESSCSSSSSDPLSYTEFGSDFSDDEIEKYYENRSEKKGLSYYYHHESFDSDLHFGEIKSIYEFEDKTVLLKSLNTIQSLVNSGGIHYKVVRKITKKLYEDSRLKKPSIKRSAIESFLMKVVNLARYQSKLFHFKHQTESMIKLFHYLSLDISNKTIFTNSQKINVHGRIKEFDPEYLKDVELL